MTEATQNTKCVPLTPQTKGKPVGDPTTITLYWDREDGTRIRCKVDAIDPLVAHILGDCFIVITTDNHVTAADSIGVIRANTFSLNQGRKLTVALRNLAMALAQHN